MQRRPSLVPDLFHIKRSTLFKSPPSARTEICGTYTDLDSAQTAALRRLQDEGYSRSAWKDYAENDLTGEPLPTWTYNANIVVYARMDHEVHTVEIESTPNSLGVRSKPGDGRVQDQLCYVLRSIESEDGSVSTEIRSIHLSRQAALTAARRELLGGDRNQDFYREYHEDPASIHAREDDDAEGAQLVVSAVGPDGEKYTVAVTHES